MELANTVTRVYEGGEGNQMALEKTVVYLRDRFVLGLTEDDRSLSRNMFVNSNVFPFS